jgi:hypothetical protein
VVIGRQIALFVEDSMTLQMRALSRKPSIQADQYQSQITKSLFVLTVPLKKMQKQKDDIRRYSCLGIANARVMMFSDPDKRRLFRKQVRYINWFVKKELRRQVAIHISTCYALKNGWSYAKYQKALIIWNNHIQE